jgi:hypothetical protein
VFHYNIHMAVPLDGTITYTELAPRLSLDASQLKQMLRQLMPIHIFAEPTPGQIAHTASSRLLATHPGIASFTGFMVEGTFPYAAGQIETFEKWGHGRPEPNRTAVSHYYGTDLSMFEYFETHAPAVRERFALLMTHMSGNPLMDNSHVARGFDWSSLAPDGVVVDVAGGMGHCSIPIAESTAPTVKLIVQDLPQIIAKAGDPATCVIPEPLRSRFEFMAYDFYAPQPVKGAAAYFLRMIVSFGGCPRARSLSHPLPSSFVRSFVRPSVRTFSDRDENSRSLSHTDAQLLGRLRAPHPPQYYPLGKSLSFPPWLVRYAIDDISRTGLLLPSVLLPLRYHARAHHVSGVMHRHRHQHRHQHQHRE